ncbi:MAG: hypothetical protein LIP01_01330 [Tannerellaceae bacterium]|nr:hypothetical protein [Tannerellaceae bacterium]
MIYLACLVDDNPFIESGYIEALESTADKIKFERLRRGNWDYDDNPNALCSYDSLTEIFGNPLALKTGVKYLTADIARFGADKAIIAVWDGWVIIDYRIFAVSKTTKIQECINFFREKYRFPRYRSIADEDGVGGGVVDNCRIKGFVNGSSPLKGENYENLQAQCGYKLAERINDNEVGFEAEISEDEKEKIIIDLEQLQSWKSDDDKKLKLKPKAEIKAEINRSPDWRDVFLMRKWFDYKGVNVPRNVNKAMFGL